jgi:CrcB protein
MDFTRILLVGVGGFLGSIARYVTVRSIDVRLNQIFPFGTLTVNVVGCFLLGLIAGLVARHGIGDTWKAFLGAGFCGGFTTFSAFALENTTLFTDRMSGMALIYIGASVAAGIVAVLLGLWCARIL